jgi:exopolysaccharide production protein ExoZ
MLHDSCGALRHGEAGVVGLENLDGGRATFDGDAPELVAKLTGIRGVGFHMGDIAIQRSPSPMTQDIERFAYIDALRGYAILGVIAVHSSQLFHGLEWPVRAIADQGARGVQLFFVVSALTLTASWQSRGDGALPFWVRRAFRIAPMFWIAVAGYTIAVDLFGAVPYWAPSAVSWQNVLASVTLVHGFHPYTINGVVPGGWSIADEVMFYVLFPFLMWALRSWQPTAIALVAAGAFVLGTRPYIFDFLVKLFPEINASTLSDFSGLFFPFQLPAFLVGILVFYSLRALSGRISRHALWIGLLGALSCIGWLPLLAAVFAGHLHWAVYLVLFGSPTLSYSLLFGLIAFCMAEGVGRPLAGVAIRHVGKVSYGAYFWHFAVLEMIGRIFGGRMTEDGLLYFLLTFTVAAALSIALATVTYWTVEEPFTAIGRKLAGRVPGAVSRPGTLRRFQLHE